MGGCNGAFIGLAGRGGASMGLAGRGGASMGLAGQDGASMGLAGRDGASIGLAGRDSGSTEPSRDRGTWAGSIGRDGVGTTTTGAGVDTWADRSEAGAGSEVDSAECGPVGVGSTISRRPPSGSKEVKETPKASRPQFSNGSNPSLTGSARERHSSGAVVHICQFKVEIVNRDNLLKQDLRKSL